MISVGELQDEVTITVWPSARKSEGGVVRRVTWTALADEYRELGNRVRAKDLLKAPSFCEIRPECHPGECDRATEDDRVYRAHRCRRSVLSVSAVGLDYDGRETDWRDVVGELDQLGLAYLVHDSPSHHSDAPKWRIYLPITEPWTDTASWNEVYKRVKTEFETLLGVRFDKQTSDPCRIFYPPTRCDELDQPRRVQWHNGRALDLSKTGHELDTPEPPARPRMPSNRSSVAERASSYLSKCEPSISGQRGHVAALHAASSLVLGFELPPDQALAMLEQEYNPRCKPPWSRKDLEHKVKSALSDGRMVRGCLLGDRRPEPELPPVAQPKVYAQVTPQEPEIDDVVDELVLIRNKEGKPKSGFANLQAVLTSAPEFRGKIRLNEFAHAIEIHGHLPWKRDGELRTWRDADDVEASAYIERQYGFAMGAMSVYQTVSAVAMAHKYHPVQDYLQACRDKWDGVKRIDSWLLDMGGCRVQPTGYEPAEVLEELARKNAYVQAVGRRFLIAAVARIFEPGCKMDTVLILEGIQGRRKSTLAKVLFSGPWFCDELADVGSKAAEEQLAGKWCIEIPELDAIKGTSATKIKAFFSRSVDRFRPAYGRAVVEYPRTCVFIGTTNKGQYLKDETGARRFQPVAVLRETDFVRIGQERDQLWAEAVLAYEAGEQWWLTQAETAIAEDEQEERYETDPLEPSVVEYLKCKDEVTVDAILSTLFDTGYGKSADRYNAAMASRVGKVLRHLGWEQVRKRTSNGGRARVYRPGLVVQVAPDGSKRLGFANDYKTRGGPGGPGGPCTLHNTGAHAHAHACGESKKSCGPGVHLDHPYKTSKSEEGWIQVTQVDLDQSGGDDVIWEGES